MKIRYQLLLLFIVIGFSMNVHAGLFDKIGKSLTGVKAQVKACKKGQTELCTIAGYSYAAGRDTAKDMDKAIEYFTLGCKGGDYKGCRQLYELGFQYKQGKSLPKDAGRAALLFETGCAGDAKGRHYSASACYESARLYLQGHFVKQDIARATQTLLRACNGGSRRGCKILGDTLIEGKLIEQDVDGAVSAYKKACGGEHKEVAACARLGLMYDDGKLIARNVASAETYLVAACTFPDWQGPSCYRLARLYESDLKGKKSAKDVADLYHIACHRVDTKLRVGKACIAAATKHLNGDGVDKDENWVNELYNRGCQIKHKESCRLSCELNCKKGQPFACAAIEKNRIPTGVTNCYKL